MTKLISLAESHRAYLYRVATALCGLLVVLGLIADGKTSAILLVVGSVLGVGGNGLAAAHTSTGRRAKRTQAGVVNLPDLFYGLLCLFVLLLIAWLVLHAF